MMRRQALQLLARALHTSAPRTPRPLRRPQITALRGWRSGGVPAGFFSTDAAAGASAAAGAAQGGSNPAAAAASSAAAQAGSKPAAVAAGSDGGGKGGGQAGKSQQGDVGKSVRGGPVSWLSFLLLLVTGGGIIVYYDKEKKRHIEVSPPGPWLRLRHPAPPSSGNEPEREKGGIVHGFVGSGFGSCFPPGFARF